jgi:hypothetical protein
MMSLNQAAAAGIERIRKPIWADAFDHFKLDIISGRPGPWLRLYAPFNVALNGKDPVSILWAIQFGTDAADSVEFEEYGGPLPDSDEYQAAVARYSEISL